MLYDINVLFIVPNNKINRPFRPKFQIFSFHLFSTNITANVFKNKNDNNNKNFKLSSMQDIPLNKQTNIKFTQKIYKNPQNPKKKKRNSIKSILLHITYFVLTHIHSIPYTII